VTQDPVYLDHNATTPVLPRVVEAMLPYLREHFGNPSSNHPLGLRARQAVEDARAQVAALLACTPDEVVFTSGGTEASNLAIRGATAARPGRRHVVTSVIEHPATAEPCRWLEESGWTVTRLGVDIDGRVRAEDLRAAIRDDTSLVTLMHASNETGVLQPVAEVALAARSKGALSHTDAAQSLGKVPVNVDELGVDLLSVAGHKLYAPKGVGALFVRRGTRLLPVVLGAGHERGVRPGTENVASIVGLGVACEQAARDLSAESERQRSLRDRLLDALVAAIPGVELNGHATDRLPNTLNVRFPSVTGRDLLAATPEVAASTGSACHDGRERASATILAMGIAPEAAVGSVRLTLGRSTTRAEVDRAGAALVAGWKRLQRS
jgi:cysteine desulfurase